MRPLAAMEEYNRLYPDAPIARLGHTPDRIWHLPDFNGRRSGTDPLSADAIAQIE